MTVNADINELRDQLSEVESRLSIVENKLTDLETRLGIVERKIDTLTIQTADLIAILDAAKGAFKVFGWIAAIAKPVAWVGLLIAALSAFWSNIKRILLWPL